ncbi:ImmA/IrrE family metallo-endopeptidase [Ferruginibacter sp.]
MINSYVEEKAEKILLDSNCFNIPIDVYKCAEYLGVEITSLDLEDDISGFFAIKNKKAHIGVNKANNAQRIRFTIGHELGHYILHAKETPLFIDKEESRLNRDYNSSTGELIKEREANAFAAALLMPRKLVIKKINELSERDNKTLIRKLSVEFDVNPKAMGIRLVNLDIIGYSL